MGVGSLVRKILFYAHTKINFTAVIFVFCGEACLINSITNASPKMLCFALPPKEMSDNSTNTSLILPVGMRS